MGNWQSLPPDQRNQTNSLNTPTKPTENLQLPNRRSDPFTEKNLRGRGFDTVYSGKEKLARRLRFDYDQVMSTKERAIAAIDRLPEGSDMADILREIAFITGTDDAREEIARGEGMEAAEAKARLREWIIG